METISFRDGAPPQELLPLEELADCAAAVLREDGKRILSYGPGAGYSPLRELIAEWFQVNPGRVVLTNGAMQALSLLGILLGRGRSVMVEWPTSERATNALLNSGTSLLAAVVDDDGLSVDDLESQLMGKQAPAFVYTMPTFQNPTGRTMPPVRRARLVASVAARGLQLVEDATYALLRFEGESLPDLFDYAGKESIFVSSFSQTISPGIRVGWTIVPDELAPRLVETATSTYIAPSLLGQATAFEFIRRGRLEAHLGSLRPALRRRRDATLEALEKHFSGARWTRPEGGCFVWLEGPPLTDMRAVLARADGVDAAPGSEFGFPANCLRLAFTAPPIDLIEPGIARLAAAMD